MIEGKSTPSRSQTYGNEVGPNDTFEVSALLVGLAALVAAGFIRASRNEIRAETREVTEAHEVETAFALD